MKVISKKSSRISLFCFFCITIMISNINIMKSAAVKEKQRTLQQNDNYLQTATDFTETEWDRDPELQKRELLEQYDENSNKEIQSGSSDNGDEKQSNVNKSLVQ